MNNRSDFGFEHIAASLRTISAETHYCGVADALLLAATSLPDVERGVAILNEQGQIFEAANAEFPRDLAEVVMTLPPRASFSIPDGLMDEVLAKQRPVILRDGGLRSAFTCADEREVDALCMPITHNEHVLGILYLEAPRNKTAFSPACLATVSMFASQAAIAFESARLFQALRETHQWMAKGQQIGRMGSYRFNPRTRTSRGSREAYDIFGLDPNVRPVPFEDYLARIHPDDIPNLEARLAAAFETGTPFHHEYRVVHEDGVVLDVVVAGEWETNEAGDVELEGIVTDVTERKAAERALAETDAQLGRAAGLANLGEIAGSIIHEINQPLTAIIAGAEASMRWLSQDEPNLEEATATMRRTIEAGHQAAAVVQSLRALASRSTLHFAEIDINATLVEAMQLARAEIDRADAVFRLDLETQPILAKGDKVQIQQVILNLVRNAADAMLSIRGRARLLSIRTLANDDEVTLSFKDTGPGIDSAVRERLFEALYTTKCGGLGLGLAICRKIICAHGGRIWAEDNDPHGTTFSFTLPRRCTDNKVPDQVGSV